MESYKLEKDLIINETGDIHTLVHAGNFLVKESTGKLTVCIEKDLPVIQARVTKDIQTRDTLVAVEIEEKRLFMEQELLEKEPILEEELVK